jgi:xanthine dehydrogenase/oxidase
MNTQTEMLCMTDVSDSSSLGDVATTLAAAYDANWTAHGAIYVNGKRVVPSAAVTGETTLLEWLRDSQGLRGAKLGCGEGACGACSVMVSRFDAATQKPVHKAVNACLMPALATLGCAVTTVEGIGTPDNMNPVQSRLAKFHGAQCGFCTPGIVMAVYALCRGHDGETATAGAADAGDEEKEGEGVVKTGLTVAEVEEHLDGNLCRCTGYRPIWDAAKSLCVDGGDIGDIEDMSAATAAGDDAVHACPRKQAGVCDRDEPMPVDAAAAVAKSDSSSGGGDGGGGGGGCCSGKSGACSTTKSKCGEETPFLSSAAERAFPVELTAAAAAAAPLRIGDWGRPTTLADAVALKASLPVRVRVICVFFCFFVLFFGLDGA